MNSSVRDPGGQTSAPSLARALRTSEMKLRWVSSAPLGLPVVPEV